MIDHDPITMIGIVAVLSLLAAGWIVLFIKTMRERKVERFYKEALEQKLTPHRGPSRDRTLPGKTRVKARRSRAW